MKKKIGKEKEGDKRRKQNKREGFNKLEGSSILRYGIETECILKKYGKAKGIAVQQMIKSDKRRWGF